jgi:predicted TIM-barrel fold metal-dependent hydrolase
LFSRAVFAFYAAQAPDLKGAADPAGAAIAWLGVEAPPAEPEALAARWVAELDRHGVARAVLFGSAPGEQGTVARAAAAFPDRFAAFQMHNPKAPGAAAALEDIVARGMRGVLLFPAMHGFYPDDPSCRPVYETARARRLAVFVHLGFLRIAIREKLGVPGTPDERFGDPARLASALRDYPDVSFIVPHFGCGTLRMLLAAAGAARNLYVDTSSSNAWMERTPEYPDLKTVFRAALDAKALGPERILFGSDSTVFPRGWRREIFEAQRAALAAVGVSPADQAAIFGGNLSRLLRGASGDEHGEL